MVPQGGHRAQRRPAVGHELHDPQPLPGLEGGGHRDPAHVGFALRLHVDVPAAGRALHHVVHARRHPDAAGLGGVEEDDPPPLGGMDVGAEGGLDAGLRPRVARPDGDRLVGHQLGLHHHPGRPVDRLDRVADGRHRPLGERHQPDRRHPHRLARGRDPLDVPGERACPQVERPLVGPDLAVADVERLVVDQQAQDLAVGDVDHRLPRLRVAVAGLGVGQGAQLVDAVEVGAGDPEGLALVEVAPQAHVAVGQGEHRLALAEEVEAQLRLPYAPRLDDVGGLADHGPEQLAQVVDDDVGPHGAERLRPAHPVDADDPPEAARPARLHPRQRILEHGRHGWVGAGQLGPGQERVGRGLASEVALLGHDPVDVPVNLIDESRRLQHVAAVGARGHHHPGQARVPTSLQIVDRPRVGLHAPLPDQAEDEVVLAQAQRTHLVLGEVDPPGRQEVAGAVVAGLAVDVGDVVGDDLEGEEGFAGGGCPLPEVAVEHLLPRRGVDGGGAGEHAVEVEQAGSYVVRQAEVRLRKRSLLGELVGAPAAGRAGRPPH